MTQHPGQHDPDEGAERSSGHTPDGDPETSSAGREEHGHQPTTPLGGVAGGPQIPEQPSAAGPGQPPQIPYGQRTTPPPQAPGAGRASSGAGYGQPSGAYPPQGQAGPGGSPYAGQPGQPPYQQQYPHQYEQHPQHSGATNRNSVEGKNFFAALFDLSFQSFVTVKFAKFIYVLLMAFIALGYLFVVIASFSDGPAAGLLVLLLGWIPAAIYLILIRITLEFVIAMVRTSQNTAGTRSEIEALRTELNSRP